ncbi:hypothetical protein BsWGS_20308 [Bradybaena similaris]
MQQWKALAIDIHQGWVSPYIHQGQPTSITTSLHPSGQPTFIRATLHPSGQPTSIRATLHPSRHPYIHQDIPTSIRASLHPSHHHYIHQGIPATPEEQYKSLAITHPSGHLCNL